MPYPKTFWDDYKNRASPASDQAMTVAHHLSKHDLKLVGQGGFNEDQLKVWDAAYGPKNAAYLAKKDTMTEKQRIEWQYQRYVKDYLRCVTSVDENIGRLLKYLDESGLAKNTVVIYSSDLDPLTWVLSFY